MSPSNGVEPEPNLQRDSCRQLPRGEKRLIEEMDALPRSDKGARLRRNGLYTEHLANWRRPRPETGEPGLEPKSGGRKPVDPHVSQPGRLRRDKARLEQQLVVPQRPNETWSHDALNRPRPLPMPGAPESLLMNHLVDGEAYAANCNEPCPH